MSDASAFALHPQSESSGVAPQNDCSDTRLHWALHDGRRGPGRLRPGPAREVRGGSHSSPLLPPARSDPVFTACHLSFGPLPLRSPSAGKGLILVQVGSCAALSWCLTVSHGRWHVTRCDWWNNQRFPRLTMTSEGSGQMPESETENIFLKFGDLKFRERRLGHLPPTDSCYFNVPIVIDIKAKL